MTWVVVTADALKAFAADYPDEKDALLRINLEAWSLLLQVTGPPNEGDFDPFRRTFKARVPGLPVEVEYAALRYLGLLRRGAGVAAHPVAATSCSR
jgi:hypothetical protein